MAGSEIQLEAMGMNEPRITRIEVRVNREFLQSFNRDPLSSFAKIS
jgi:hypothetical protein